MRGKHENTGGKAKFVMNSTFMSVVLGILLIVAIGLIIAQAVKGKDEEESSKSEPSNSAEQNEEPVEKLTDTIKIPGYTELYFKADVKEQDDCIVNPEENTCLFEVELSLEDGTVLWQSGEIAPGEKSPEIVLNEPLEAGIYKNVVLGYRCFSMNEERKELNGANTKLTLKVN